MNAAILPSSVIGANPAAPEYMPAVDALTASLDGFKAVNHVSFYVDPNEIRVIIGPNGAGMTTVLDLICGRTRASAGSIKDEGQELRDRPIQRDRGRPRPRTDEWRRLFSAARWSAPPKWWPVRRQGARRDGDSAARSGPTRAAAGPARPDPVLPGSRSGTPTRRGAPEAGDPYPYPPTSQRTADRSGIPSVTPV